MALHIQAFFTMTVQGWPELVVVSVDGVESLGRPYDFWITAVAPTGSSFDAREAVGDTMASAIPPHVTLLPPTAIHPPQYRQVQRFQCR